MMDVPFVIVGAGPAGLAAAYDLARRGERPVVLEKDDQVGGLSRTILRNGYRFDIGGHRFFTRNAEVSDLWRSILGDELLHRTRLSRILHRRRFYQYPLRLGDVLAGLGPLAIASILGSYLRSWAMPIRPELSLEDWITNRFGRTLFRTFFRNYTEKVCGIPCGRVSADWAAQRIRNLDLRRAVLRAMGIGHAKGTASLIEGFDYPRLGPGQMYEAMAAQAQTKGATILTGREVIRIEHDEGRVTRVTARTPDGMEKHPARGVISSMPLSDLVAALWPPAEPEALTAASQLRYRSILTVNLVVRTSEIAPDNWIYLHDARVRAGRLQLYKNWSPDLVPDAGKSTVGLEYFINEGSVLWRSEDQRLVDLAKRDLKRIGLIDPELVEDGFVARYAKAYPVYDLEYRERVRILRRCVGRIGNLVCVGRYGQFRYNNMDHSILTALLGVRRLLGEDVDPWSVNAEAQYHQESFAQAPVAPVPAGTG